MNRPGVGLLVGSSILIGASSACSAGSAAKGAPSLVASASASATSSTAPSAPLSSPIPGLACKLPVVQWTQTSQGQTPSAGFISFPSGQFSPDPSGGPRPSFYDWPLERWLPTDRRRVSPDGSHYAYEGGFGSIHDVEVATGRDRSLKAPEGPDTVLYYAREGIYFNHSWEGPPGPGLWLLDPATGAIHTVFSDVAVDAVGGFAAWVPKVNPADPHPAFSQFAGTNYPNQILRRDLNGAATLPWFYRPGKNLTVVGFDQDKHPLIAVASGESSPVTLEIWQVPAANQGRMLYSGTDLPRPMADSHGIWFSDRKGIWLYTPTDGLRRVSPITADIAGACQ